MEQPFWTEHHFITYFKLIHYLQMVTSGYTFVWLQFQFYFLLHCCLNNSRTQYYIKGDEELPLEIICNKKTYWIPNMFFYIFGLKFSKIMLSACFTTCIYSSWLCTVQARIGKFLYLLTNLFGRLPQ